MRINPFAHLIETKSYKNARLIRSSFFIRMRDVFTIFYGGFLGNDFGVLDYIFPIPRLLQLAIDRLARTYTKNNTVNYISWGLAAALMLPAFLLNTPKFLISWAITLVSMPILVIVHATMKGNKDNLMKKINTLGIRKVKDGTYNHLGTDYKRLTKSISTSDYLEKSELNTKVSLKGTFEEDELMVAYPLYKKTLDNNSKKIVYDTVKPSNPERAKELLHGIVLVEGYWSNMGNFDSKVSKDDTLMRPLAVIEINERNAIQIDALLKLNIFRAAEKLEKTGMLDEVEKRLDQYIFQRADKR